jgi:hypothetical protein
MQRLDFQTSGSVALAQPVPYSPSRLGASITAARRARCTCCPCFDFSAPPFVRVYHGCGCVLGANG